MNTLLLTTAVKSAYDMIVSVNLTMNRYVMINYERFPHHHLDKNGLFDDMINQTASNIPPASKQSFLDTFSRESLIQAYQEGRTTITMDFPQINEEGKTQTVHTTVLLMEDSRNGDILDITLFRIVN